MNLETLYTEFPSRSELTLKPFLRFLEGAQNPHKHLSPVIHVAGTNGKGSTVAMLRSIYQEAGYSVHAFTSPHLVSLTERFIIGSRQIEEKELKALLKAHTDLAKQYCLSWFELLTGIFFITVSNWQRAHKEKTHSVVLLETGLGGEFDATNVIPHSDLCLLTPISYDHKEWLGNDIRTIAKAKAGIIKPKSKVLSHPQHQDVIPIIKSKTKHENAELTIVSDYDTRGITCHLRGEHQKENASAVKKALALMNDKLPITDQSIERGLQAVNWPGRLQAIYMGNDNKGFPCVYYDVGHNPHAARSVAMFLKAQDGKKTVLLCIPKAKDYAEILNEFSRIVDEVLILNLNDVGFHPPEIIHNYCITKKILSRIFGPSIFDMKTLGALSLQDLMNNIPNADHIVIMGSHKLASLFPGLFPGLFIDRQC